MPSDSPDEDGTGMLATVELLDAEPVAWDSFTGEPLLVRRKLGRGWVYTFTIWAYPGHERFQKFCAAWVQRLAEQARGDFYAEDPSGEVFWTIWEAEGERRMWLLNTDWTEPGNEKIITVYAEDKQFSLTVQEGILTEVTIQKGKPVITNHRL